jgi:hypothetical protein
VWVARRQGHRADLHVPGHEVGDRLHAALVRNVLEPDAVLAREIFADHVAQRSHPRRDISDRLAAAARQCDELRERGHRERGMCGDHDRRAADIGDVGEILHGVEGRIGARRRRDDVRGDAGDHEGGAVGIGVGDRGGADHAARARPVLHQDALRESIAEMLGKHTADQVGASPRRPRHHDTHRLARPRGQNRLRMRSFRHCSEAGEGADERDHDR